MSILILLLDGLIHTIAQLFLRVKAAGAISHQGKGPLSMQHALIGVKTKTSPSCKAFSQV
jgi:hypothetical protein